MPKAMWRVTYTVTQTYSREIEAETEEEAQGIAEGDSNAFGSEYIDYDGVEWDGVDYLYDLEEEDSES